MMEFRVRAVRSVDHRSVDHTRHAVEDFVFDAGSVADARAQTEAQGLTVISIAEHRPFLSLAKRPQGLGKNRAQLHSFNTELFALLKAGLSLIESLEALVEKENNAVRAAMLHRLIAAIQSGKRFSIALAEQPMVFPPLYIGIIKASEQTSDLPQALSRYIDYTQREDTLRGKVLSAAIYPTILLLVGSIVILFLIGYVVPRFAEVYRDAGRNLPWMSQLLLTWGHFFQQHTKSIVLLGGLGLAAVVVLFSRKGFAPVLHLIKKIPLIREKLNLLELSRLYLTLGMLQQGGIVILEAISIVEESVTAHCKAKLRCAAIAIKDGASLSSAFHDHQLTTSISFRLLRVGEKSGQMGMMLTQAAEFYETEIATWIDRFSRAFEPILMAIIGLIVGVIVVLLYMPIFDLAGSLS